MSATAERLLEGVDVKLLFEPGDDLALNEKEHLYTFRGMPVPSVTSLLVEFGYIDTSFYREWHAWRGSVVHKCCELLDLDELDESSVDQRIRPYVDAYQLFKSDLDFRPVAVERRIYHPRLKVAGTFDRVGWIGKFPALVDIKSGRPHKATAIQTAGYAGAFDKALLFRRFAVWVRIDGKYQMHEYEPASYAWHWSIFQSLAIAHWGKQEMN